MTYLLPLPENATLLDVFRAYPDTTRPLPDYHHALRPLTADRDRTRTHRRLRLPG